MARQSKLVYKFIAGNLALDFTNTVHTAALPDPRDEFKKIEDLLDWARRARLLTAQYSTRLTKQFQSRPVRAQQALARALRLRSVIYRLFSRQAESGNIDEKALAQFNRWFRTAMSHVRIIRQAHGVPLEQTKGRLAFGWDLPSSRPLDRILWEITRSAADLLLSSDLQRVGQCKDDFCSWLFVDASRNGRRCWCSMQLCGNRARVRSYRSRQSA